jgi:hypothetical protein
MTDHVMTARLMATTQTSAGMGAGDNGIEVVRRARGQHGRAEGRPWWRSRLPQHGVSSTNARIATRRG